MDDVSTLKCRAGDGRVVLVSDAATELNFIVCELDGEFWEVFLQTGSDEPSGRTRSNYQTIHLPCLC